MRSRITRLLYFLSLFFVYTSYKSYQLWPTQPVLAVFFALIFFIVMIIGTFAYRIRPNIYDETWFRVVSWAGSLAMGLWASFVIISLPFDIFHAVTFVFGKNFFTQEVSVRIFGFAILLSLIGFLQVVRGPKIVEVSIAIPGLNQAFEGLKIAQISDLHVGTTIRKGYVEEVVRITNAALPDLIFLTGDIADAHPGSIAENLAPLAHLKSRYGSYFVTGNHEYFWDPQALTTKFRELKMNVLLNDHRIIKVGDRQLMIAGVTDPVGEHILPGHKPNASTALTTNEKIDLKILLSHRPDVYREAEGFGADLQFSGHTHAGQFFPFSLFIGLAHKYSRGLYRYGRMWVYVNPGTGYWGPANRLGVTAEVTLVTCRAGEA